MENASPSGERSALKKDQLWLTHPRSQQSFSIEMTVCGC